MIKKIVFLGLCIVISFNPFATAHQSPSISEEIKAAQEILKDLPEEKQEMLIQMLEEEKDAHMIVEAIGLFTCIAIVFNGIYNSYYKTRHMLDDIHELDFSESYFTNTPVYQTPHHVIPPPIPHYTPPPNRHITAAP